VNILVKNTPAEFLPWFAVMLDDDDDMIAGTGSSAKTRDEAIDLCVERYRLSLDKVPDERIPYPPVPQSIKAV
jgi:hypothetical protein